MSSQHVLDEMSILIENIMWEVEWHSPVRRQMLTHELFQGEIPRYAAFPSQKYAFIRRAFPNVYRTQNPLPTIIEPEVMIVTGTAEILVPTWELATMDTIRDDDSIVEAGRRIGREFRDMEERAMNALLAEATAAGVKVGVAARPWDVSPDSLHGEQLPLGGEMDVSDFFLLPGDIGRILPVRQSITVLPANEDEVVIYEEIGMVVGGHLWEMGAVRFLDVEEEIS